MTFFFFNTSSLSEDDLLSLMMWVSGCAAIENSTTCNYVIIIRIVIRPEKAQQIEQPRFSVYVEPNMNVRIVLIPLLRILGTFTPTF